MSSSNCHATRKRRSTSLTSTAVSASPLRTPCRVRSSNFHPFMQPTSQENEPDIYRAIRFGTILENVVFDEEVGLLK